VACIHMFSGEPMHSFLIALMSVITGITVSLIFMWPFAFGKEKEWTQPQVLGWIFMLKSIALLVLDCQ
jgi:hypothetical protein